MAKEGGLAEVSQGPGSEDNICKTIEPVPVQQTEARKTWVETAAAAGVLTMVQAGDDSAADEENVNPAKDNRKKKTPKEYRTEMPKVKEAGKQATVAEKKLFKEAFNTDKTRLQKRQQKYHKEQNFLIIMEDNILGPGAATAGKWMVYGQGKIKERFLSDGIIFDPQKFYMHANHTDFKKEIVIDGPKESDEPKEIDETKENDKTKEKKRKNENEVNNGTKENVDKNGSKENARKASCSKKFKPLKVATPGTYFSQISDGSGDDTN